nr:MAG TPA: hypothetical protein [Caudoviricetes sp.]
MTSFYSVAFFYKEFLNLVSVSLAVNVCFVLKGNCTTGSNSFLYATFLNFFSKHIFATAKVRLFRFFAVNIG